MTDEAHQSTGDGAVNHCQEGQQTVLDGDVGVGHGAGDGYEPAQNEEQGSTNADGDNGFYREFFHASTSKNLLIPARAGIERNQKPRKGSIRMRQELPVPML